MPLDPLDPRSRSGASDASVPARAQASAPPMDADPLDLDGVASGEVELLDEDRELLVALAAFQLRYGEDAEALAYLLAARAVFPGDPDVLRLLAHALVKLDRTEEADEVLTELDRVARPTPPLAILSRALVRLAQGRMDEARRLFDRYRDARDHAA